MTQSFSQYAGETRDYQQSIINDTIVSVAWSAVGGGGSVTVLIPGTNGTSTTGRLTTTIAGTCILKVTITCASGQVVIGEAKINVS